MTDVKRPNYATGQFLTATDFQREQSYHQGLRRLHNRALHTPGIASGLEVAKVDDTHVSVTAGAAFDGQGREILLAADAVLDLSGQRQARQLWVTIGYGEVTDPADIAPIGGVDTPIATTERPVLLLTDATPAEGAYPSDPVPPPDGVLVLALLGLESGQLVVVDPSSRPIAGAVLSSLARGRTLELSAKISAQEARFTYLNAPRADIDNAGFSTLSTNGQASFGGTLSVGSGDLQFPNVWRGLTTSFTPGFASIQNVSDIGALVIQGRAIDNRLDGNYRLTKLYDVLEVNSVVNVKNFNGRRGTIQVDGDVWVGGRLIANSKSGFVMDRFVNRLGETLEAGDVVVIGATTGMGFIGEAGEIPVPEVDLATGAYDTRVCGIVWEVHGEPGADGAEARLFSAAEREGMDLSRVAPGQFGHMVTLGAYAHCKVDADIAPIAAGDLLTTSPTRGHAQKVLDRGQALGAVVGKALAPLAAGRGLIPVLVTLQ